MLAPGFFLFKCNIQTVHQFLDLSGSIRTEVHHGRLRLAAFALKELFSTCPAKHNKELLPQYPSATNIHMPSKC